MKIIEINEKNSDTRLINILKKAMPKAGNGFLFKMLRKKNIKLNGSKATGNEEVKVGDKIEIFFSDETFEKFSEGEETETREDKVAKPTIRRLRQEEIIYEDEDILLVNKPVGELSQKADNSDVSMVEIIQKYLLDTGKITEDELKLTKPAVVNRLDRNTSGIVACGKTTRGLKFLSEGIKNRDIKKYYICLVKGRVVKGRLLNGLWSKDSHGNKVKITPVETIQGSMSFPEKYWVKGNVPVQTLYEGLVAGEYVSVVKVELFTGKTHQIRAHMALIGNPLVGDHKYGDKSVNLDFKRRYGVFCQLLHAYMMEIPGKGTFVAELPKEFKKVIKGEGLWERGIQEAFEDRGLNR